jgi:hypothetical protein
MMSPVVIKTLLATAGITDPALVEFVTTLVAISEDVKQEPCDAAEVHVKTNEYSRCLKISGVVKGKPMLAFLVLTN